MSARPPAPVLDLNRLRDHPFIARVDWHPTLASTSDRALALAAAEPIETPLLVLADEQTAGRGRGGNAWWSARGALTFSLILTPQADRFVVGPGPLPQERWPRIALAAGLALCETLETLVPHLAFGLKWPNDVQLGGKKLAGILVEVPPAGARAARRIVLGMGANVNNSLADAPAEIQEAGAALCDAGGLEFDATRVLLAWLTRFADNLQALARADADLAERWRARCVLSGKRVELRSGDRTLCGLCRGIDGDGALLLDTPAGRERLYAGGVVRVLGPAG